MKKILTKSLRRLHTLLLMAVLFVVGGSSAWADTVAFFDYNTGDGTTTTKNDVTVTLGGGWNAYGNGYGCYVGGSGTYTITVDSDSDIKSIELDNESKTVDGMYYVNFGVYYVDNWTTSSGQISKTTAGATISGISEGVKSITITMNTGGSTNVNQITVTVADGAPAELMDFTVSVTGTSDPEAGVVYDGKNYGAGETVSALSNLKATNLAATPVSGYVGTVSISGSIITVSYEAIPADFVITTNLGEYSYTQYGVTVSSTMTWSNCLEIWANHSTLTVESEYFDIEKIEFVEYSNSTMSLSSTVPGNYANNVWSTTTPSKNIVFSTVSGDYRIKSIHIYAAQPPVEYTVRIVDAPGVASVSVAGIDGTFGNGDNFEGSKGLSKESITATEFEGYKYEVTISEDGVITVTYVERVAPQEAEINFFNTNFGPNNTNLFGDDFYKVEFSSNYTRRWDYGARSSMWGDTSTFTVSTTAGNIAKIELLNGLPGDSDSAFDSSTFSVNPVGNTTDNTNDDKFVWMNESSDEVSSVTFSTKKGIAIGSIKVTLGAPVEDTEYTVVFNPANEGASATIAGKNVTPANNKFSVKKALDATNVENVTEPTGWYYDNDVTFSENTFYITYKKYDEYTVSVNNAEGRAVVDEEEYADGATVYSKGEPTNVAYKEVNEYDGEVVVDNENKTITVTYTAWPTWKISIVNVPESYEEGATITIDGKKYKDGESLRRKTLEKADITPTRITSYGASVSVYASNHTVIVSYAPLAQGEMKFDLSASVTPEQGSIDNCPEDIVIKAPSGVTFDYPDAGTSLPQSFKVNGTYKAFMGITARPDRITIPFDQAPVEFGTITIEIPAGTFKGTYVDNGVTKSTTHEACTLTYTIPYRYTYTQLDKNGNTMNDGNKTIKVNGVTYTAYQTIRIDHELTEEDVDATCEGYETKVVITPMQKSYDTWYPGGLRVTYTKIPVYEDFAEGSVATTHGGTNRVLSSEVLYFKDAVSSNSECNEEITFNGKAIKTHSLRGSSEDGYAKQASITFEEVTETGTYELVIPKGYYIIRTVNGDPIYNNEYRISYDVLSYEYIDIANVSKMDGKTVSGIATDVLTFDRDVEKIWGRPTFKSSAKTLDATTDIAGVKVTVDMGSQTADGTYTLTFAKGLIEFTDGTWNNEFSLTYTVNTPALVVKEGYGWTTFCLDIPFALPEGYIAKIVSSESENVLTLTEVEGVIPANCGILVKAEDDNFGTVEYTKFPAATECADVTGNMLTPALEAKTIENDVDHLYYRLSKNAANEDDTLGFYWHPSSEDGHSMTMTANKAYLILDTPADGGESNFRIIGFENENPTSIDSLLVDENICIFDLQGNRVRRESLRSGVYVVNGRKVVVK